MSRQIGSVVLPDNIQWTNQFDWVPVSQETARTLKGNQVLWAMPVQAGQPITLELFRGVSWLTTDQVTAIQTMAAVAGAVYPLVWDALAFNVVFDCQNGLPCKFTPLWPGHYLFLGTIKLLSC